MFIEKSCFLSCFARWVADILINQKKPGISMLGGSHCFDGTIAEKKEMYDQACWQLREIQLNRRLQVLKNQPAHDKSKQTDCRRKQSVCSYFRLFSTKSVWCLSPSDIRQNSGSDRHRPKQYNNLKR